MDHDADHDWAWPLLAEFLMGGLPPGERARLEAHADACLECSAGLAALDRCELTVTESRPPLKDRLLERFHAVKASPAARALLAGAAVVLLGVIGLILTEIEPRLFRTERLLAVDGEAAVISSPACAMTITPMERPRDVFERRGVMPDKGGMPVDEPVIFFPEARESDHNESADGEDFHQMKGDSANFLSYIKGEPVNVRGRQAGAYDTMGVGVGGGGGGRYGGRFGGRAAVAVVEQKGIPLDDGTGGVAYGGRANRVMRGSGAGSEAVMTGKVLVPGKEEVPQEEAPRQSRKIIRSGEMEFEVDSFDSSVATVTKIALEEQGYIATVNSEKLQNGKVRGTVVVRVPPEHLDTLLLKLRALGELKSQRIGSQDVSKTYLDLESRLRAARTMEERLLNIIKEGKGAIKDLLQAEKELGEWRTKIESMVGEINYYNNLIAHSTLSITLAEKEIRAPYGILETERVDMGVEVEDVEKAHREALAAIAEAKGRVSRSELKQLAAGQFNALIHFEVAPDRAGAVRDRLKQLGVLARLDINRTQEQQGGTGKPQDAKIQQNDTQIQASLYNLANATPRETVVLSLASGDAEKTYKAILAGVEKLGGRVERSHLTRLKNDQTMGTLSFHVRSADAENVLADARAGSEILKLEVSEVPDAAATRSRKGFNITIFGLGAVQPRETSTVVLATRDVASGYRGLVDAMKAAEGRILNAQLNENDRKNMTGTISVEIRREHEKELADAAAKAGEIYTRNSTRAQDADNVTDSKMLVHFRLFDAANIPARETMKLGLEVGDVEAAARSLEAAFRGRIVDSHHSREASGRRESLITIDVPLAELGATLERIKAAGSLLDHTSTRNLNVPDNAMALGRFEVRLTNEVLVEHTSGPWANIKKGLGFSLQAASWSLMLIMIGVCFVLPLLLVIWTGVRIHRKLRPRPAPAA